MAESEDAAARGRAAAEDAIVFLQELIRLQTHEPEGYAPAADAVSARLVQLGFDVERQDVLDADGRPVPTVLGWAGPRSREPAIILVAHLDTNPANEGWSVPPYDGVRRDGRVLGRGAVIAKSDVSAFIYGTSAAVSAASTHDRTALIAITCDEGGGGYLGPGYILGQLEIRPGVAVTPGFTTLVGVAHNGAVQGIVTVTGTACHQAAVDPERDAMQHAVRIASAIGARDGVLRAKGCSIAGIEHPTFNVTRFSAGRSFGMAPGVAELYVDRRVTPDEALADAEREVRDTIEGVDHGPEISVDLRLFPGVEPLRPTAEQERWADVVRAEAAAVLGQPVPAGGLPIYTDARWFARSGIPTVLFGAGQPDLAAAGINGVDESVSERDVASTVEIVARVVARVLDRTV